MNTTALRGLLLGVNLILIGIVMWVSVETFLVTDSDRWNVEPPTFSDFNVPVISEDPAQRDRALYRTIVDLFEIEEPKKVKVVEAPVVDEDEGEELPPPLQQITVTFAMAFGDDSRGAKNMVVLTPPSGGTGEAFVEGMELSKINGFKDFPNVFIKEITRKEVIFTDKDGKELDRISGKPAGKKGR